MKNRIVQSVIENIGHAHSNSIGLFNGTMGVCMALYHVYLEAPNEYVGKAAEDLLDEVIHKMPQLKDMSFENGILGIGWAINKLHMEMCIQGDIDDILYNIDASLYRALTEPDAPFFKSMSNLLGALAYMVDRLSNPFHDCASVQHLLNVDMLRLIMNNLSVMVPAYLANINRDTASCVAWNVFVLFRSLAKAIRFGICNNQINQMMYMWETQLCTSFPFFHNNRLLFACVLESLNVSLGHQPLTEYTKLLLRSIDESSIRKEAISHVHCISTGWGYAVWILNFVIKCKHDDADMVQLLSRTRSVIMRKGIREFSLTLNRVKNPNVSLVGGLSGILLLFYSKKSIL